jgi:signal transduction histidine kinase
MVVDVPGADADAGPLADQPAASPHAQTREDLRGLVDEQAALRRVAELVAVGASQPSVFDAVALEACRLLGGHFTALLRYEPDGIAVIVAMWGADAVRHVMHVGMRLAEDGDGLVQRVQRSARAQRVDSYEGVPGSNATTARALGLTSGVGAPIISEGRVWGAITVLGSGPSLPASAEDRLEMFAKLVATAIANAQARANLAALADEQAGLRRVAELVARGAAPREIFAAVATEASALLDDQAMTLVRYEGERELVVVASAGGPARVGERIRFEAETLPERVRREDRVVRVDDYTRERDSSLADSYGLAAAVAAPISLEAEVWGMLTATSSGAPLAVGTEHRLQQFAELVAAALATSQARADLQALADEQTALRRIAELTAQEAPTDAVLEAVAVQASRLASVEFGMVLRFEPDGSTEIVALDGAPANFEVGMRAPSTGDGAVHRVWRTGRAARIDDLGSMSGQWPQMAARFGFSTSAGVPILLEGGLWGAIIVVGRDGPMPPAIETHLTDFAELVGTAISAAQARGKLRVLADEQAALRRVAELVARGAALDEVFTAVATEASKLLGDLAAALLRYDPGGVAVTVAVCNSPAPLGLRVPSDSRTATGEVLRTGRPVRVDGFKGTRLPGLARELDVEAGVAVPVMVEGRVWGALTTSTPGAPLPPGTEQRLAQFAELAGAAIANAENKAKLTASRARVVATADETRRRLQRDVHDSAQQRLVHTIITLKLARDAIAAGDSAGALVEEALINAERANAELRDVVRGILPAALTRGGLRTGLESLVADLAVPVDVRVTAPRLSTQTETTAYFIVAEALTNVVKHAQADRATVEVGIEAETLSIYVHDNGAGGADPAQGTGLTGMLDRVEASEGTLRLDSPAGIGTTLHATLPLRERIPPQ